MKLKWFTPKNLRAAHDGVNYTAIYEHCVKHLVESRAAKVVKKRLPRNDFNDEWKTIDKIPCKETDKHTAHAESGLSADAEEENHEPKVVVRKLALDIVI